MRYTTWQRITSILEEVTAIAGTTYTVAPSTPKAKQNYEGYMALVRPSVFPTIVLNADQRRYTTVWNIDLYSPEVLLGLSYEVEGYMYQYADAIADIFLQRSMLQNAQGQILTGVQAAYATREVFQAPAPYPDGQQEKQMYRWTMTLQVELLSSRRC